MFNFQNLNDYEFEMLSKDIISRILGVDLRTYTKGRDGGIDIRGFIGNEFVVQAKHYPKSTFPNLRTAMNKELKKLTKINPKKYLLITSFDLTPDNEDEIFGMFNRYMESKEQIYDSTRINEFLESENNIDIVKKNYKLWLTSSNILNIISNNSVIIDSDSFTFEIEKKINLFVPTKQYCQAIDLLEKNNCILLDGLPGVGKTTISQMLVAHCVKEGFRLKYVSNNSIQQIKDSLYNDNDKEIIIINDFLGQHYISYKQELLNELKSLIIYFLKNNLSTKKLILNSRVTILNEVMNRNNDFNQFINDDIVRKIRVNISELTLKEKAEILYSHVYYNKIPNEIYKDLVVLNRYLNIIDHPNFNPRIIEYVTRKSFWKGINPEAFYTSVIAKLDNPKDVWRDEFDNLSKYDRILMNTLYSLTNDNVDINILRAAFNRRILNSGDYDSTINVFIECLERLSDSLLNNYRSNDEKVFIGVINPSVNDFMYHQLKENSNEIIKIINNYDYIEQLVKMLEVNENTSRKEIENEITDGKIKNLKAFSAPVNYHLLHLISKLNIKNKGIESHIYNALFNRDTFKNDLKKNSEMFLSFLCNAELVEYYELYTFFNDLEIMNYVYEMTDYNFMKKFIPIHELYLKELRMRHSERLETKSHVFDNIRYHIKWAVELEIIDQIRNDIIETVRKRIKSDLDDYYEEEERILKEFSSKLSNEITRLSIGLVRDLNSAIICDRELLINRNIIVQELDYSNVIYQEINALSNGASELNYISPQLNDDKRLINNLLLNYSRYDTV
ncbi:restriction endonuclease [Paenibacillus agaridevorans]|uniref:restriction endonuclease n=1 Tax=Paenibacillus agaridevorans TaxID=171404 RepID=UPI001BE4267E|nr:restriction endonuclease [Paenibacillus agaridevorans]